MSSKVNKSHARWLVETMPPIGALTSNDFNRFLYVRGHAQHSQKEFSTDDGLGRMVNLYTPTTKRLAGQPVLLGMEGNELFPCVHCGELLDNMTLGFGGSDVTIGCLAWIKHVQPINLTGKPPKFLAWLKAEGIVRSGQCDEQVWRRVSVTRRGNACATCQHLFSVQKSTFARLESQLESIKTSYADLCNKVDTERNRAAAIATRVPCEKHHLGFCAACNKVPSFKLSPSLIPPANERHIGQVPFLDVEDAVRDYKAQSKQPLEEVAS